MDLFWIKLTHIMDLHFKLGLEILLLLILSCLHIDELEC